MWYDEKKRECQYEKKKVGASKISKFLVELLNSVVPCAAVQSHQNNRNYYHYAAECLQIVGLETFWRHIGDITCLHLKIIADELETRWRHDGDMMSK